MRLAESLLRQQVDDRLSRGTILRLQLDHGTLSDPNVQTRYKYAVLLNTYCPPDPDAWFVLTTSNHTAFDQNPQFESEIIRIAAGNYCFTQPTIINGRELHSLPMTQLRELYVSSRLSIEGALSSQHLATLDAIVKATRNIEPARKRHVGPPD